MSLKLLQSGITSMCLNLFNTAFTQPGSMPRFCCCDKQYSLWLVVAREVHDQQVYLHLPQEGISSLTMADDDTKSLIRSCLISTKGTLSLRELKSESNCSWVSSLGSTQLAPIEPATSNCPKLDVWLQVLRVFDFIGRCYTVGSTGFLA